MVDVYMAKKQFARFMQNAKAECKMQYANAASMSKLGM